MRAFLRGGKWIHKRATTHRGQQTVKQLVKQGGTLTNIEIKDENIKSFEGIAKKYGIDFAVKKDSSETPAKYLVFFKSRDADTMRAAFDEFSSRELNKSAEKPSIRQTLQRMMEKVRNQVLDQEKYKDRGRER
jgi:hypothetical protein